MTTNDPMTQERLDAIVSAWTNPGPQPRYHRAMQREVHRVMPVLAAALERAYLDAIRRRPAPLEGVTTVNEDMVERAARESWCLDMQGNHALWNKLPDEKREPWRNAAYIALDAALNPRDGS